MRRVFCVVVFLGAFIFLGSSLLFAYEEAPVSSPAAVSGRISFKGKAPAPKVFDLIKFPNSAFCGNGLTDPEASIGNVGVQLGKDAKGEEVSLKGTRELREIRVGKDGGVKDVVVFIKEINKGKPFEIEKKGVDFIAKNCFFQHQGKSIFVGVMVRKGEVRFGSEDDVLHNPHSFELVPGKAAKTLTNKPLPQKGTKVIAKARETNVKDALFIQCDQHQYMQNHLLAVDNPYYDISADGSFTIDQVPAGNYTLVAWHPRLGVKEQKITVAAGGKVEAKFEFAESDVQGGGGK